MALIPQLGKAAYHLFNVDPLSATPISLIRKAKWNSHHTNEGNRLYFDISINNIRCRISVEL